LEARKRPAAVTVDPKRGDVVRVFDKDRGIEVLSEGSCCNEIQILEETGDSEGRLNFGKRSWTPMAFRR